MQEFIELFEDENDILTAVNLDTSSRTIVALSDEIP
jgi:hypothetical protein